ncbi:uncharacterized protein At4g04980-like [Setaria italica]|uniref:uncharacterized protein At4g04980-like n=1 Tax=Setaria italica TaxID=4555 RepID=UPI000BE504E3|nr:uncharacterized protein At4g04980-like [Setaria italica]
MPMLLQSWEAMQDDNASPALVSPTDAQPADEAAPTAQQGTVDVGDSAISLSMEAGQPSPSSSMDGNAAVPSLLAPPPLPAHRDRVQQGPSADKPVEALASASPPPPPPPPPPSVEQEGPPAKVSRAPPPPPPGNISAALRAKRAAGKLKRSAQMGTLYRHLRDRVEGSCAHGGKAQARKKPRTPGGPKGDAGQGMADALAEMTKRSGGSAYFRQIEEDAETHAATILELKDAISSFQSKDMGELARFLEHVEQQLVCLTDETQAGSHRAQFEGFPCKKLDSLRMAAALYSKLDGTVSKLKGWKLAAPVSKQLDRVEGYFNKIKDDVDVMERNKEEEMNRFQSHGIHLDFGVLVWIKECMESQDAKATSARSPPGPGAPQAAAAPPLRMLWRVFQLAFRVYNFAGGQDERADRLTAILAREIEAHPL